MSTPANNTPILVQKYGGTSVATADHIRRVAKRVVVEKRKGKAVVVVVSAMGKTTDELISLSKELSGQPARREMDMLLHAGEIISASLLAIALEEEGERAVSLTGSQAGMITDDTHMQARIEEVEGEREDLKLFHLFHCFLTGHHHRRQHRGHCIVDGWAIQ